MTVAIMPFWCVRRHARFSLNNTSSYPDHACATDGTGCLWQSRKLECMLGEQALTSEQLVFKVEDLAGDTECVYHRRGVREALVVCQTRDNIMMRCSDPRDGHLHLVRRRRIWR